MKRLLVLLLVACTTGVFAQPRPRLDPLPEPPPPPPGTVRADSVDEPRVRIPVREGDQVEEVRENGRVIMLKVTPPNAPSYFLMDIHGTGDWMRREPLDGGNRVPMWSIHTFD